MDSRLKYGKQFAKEAGKELLKWFDKELTIEKKGEIDLVTEADKKSEAYIMGSIFQKFPEDKIIAEESGIIEREKAEYCWIIDPLDGTTNFTQKFYMFSVSIAIQKDGDTIIGIVYIPYLDQLFYAEKGKGAYLNGDKISVSNKESLIDSVIATGFPYFKNSLNKNNLKQHNNVITQCRDIRRCGSAAIDLVYTALGIWDGYWELGLKPWDLAAGALIVEESGGKVINMGKDNFDPFEGTVVCGNKKIVNQLIPLLTDN